MTGRSVVVVVALLTSTGFAAAEWPQFGGPGRDFRIAGLEIQSDWTGWGLLWEADLGPGYSGIVTDGRRLVTMTRSGESEVVLALDPDSGRTLWRHEYPAPIPTDGDSALDTTWGSGPNGTPLLVADRIYTLGFTGVLSCLEAASGRLVWRHDLAATHGLEVPFFGLSTSPIRFQDLVIVVAGGARAFRLESGEPVWANTEFDASYASPVLHERDGETTLVAGVAGSIVGLRPTDGALRWRHDHSNEHDTILSSPVVGADDLIFASAYFLGSVGLEVSAAGDSVRELWESPKVQISYTNAIREGNTVLGFHNSILKAVDLETGELLWQSRAVARGNLLAIGERYLLLDRYGKLSLLSLSDSGVTSHTEAQILEGRSWTVPTLSGSVLYARNLEKIVAIDLARPKGPRTASTQRVEPPKVRVEAPEGFLSAKRSLLEASLRSDRAELAKSSAEFERWAGEPPSRLTPLAHYYAGFAAFHEALLADEDDTLAYLRRAERHFTEATRLEGDFADAHAFLGRIFPMYYRYDPERAAIAGPLGGEHADTALRLEPNNPRVLAFKARSLFYRPAEHGGDREAALETMRHALDGIASEPINESRAEPDWGHAEIWVWYGEMLEGLDRPERSEDGPESAAEAFRRALDIAPEYARARELLAATASQR